MNRNEWVTLAFTLVGAGGTYYITQKPMWSLAALVLGLLIMLALFLFDKPKESHPAQPGNQASDSFRQNLSNVGNASASSSPVAIGQYIDQRPYPTPASVPTRTAPELPKSVPPTVECVRTRTINITDGGHYGDCLVEAPAPNPSYPQAVVAFFRNTPSEGTDEHPDIHNVQAQIVYRDNSGNEIQDVPKGVWLNSRGISTHLALNDTEGLVLMCLVSGSILQAPYRGAWKTFALGQVATIDVCLTSHNSGRNRLLLRKTFKFMDEDGHIDAIMLPPT
jgi:hypothetical protein